MKHCCFLLSALFLAACNSYQTVVVTLPDDYPIQARLADTPEKQTKGLMFVKHLPENEGMLFAFDQETEQLFWMKNTLIDLDIVFIGADQRVTSVDEQVPHSYTYTPDNQVAYSAGFGKYVLELPAKTAARHGVAAGTKLRFNLNKK